MSRLSLFASHPVSFREARARGLVRAIYMGERDGDTFYFHEDLGQTIYTVAPFRLAEIDSFEVVGVDRARGLEARDFVRALLLGVPCLLEPELYQPGRTPAGMAEERTSSDRYVSTVRCCFTAGEIDLGAVLVELGYEKGAPPRTAAQAAQEVRYLALSARARERTRAVYLEAFASS